jgi:nucleoside-diphosphate kinase
VIHGSDALETAQREVGLWFAEGELSNWSPTMAPWIHE